MLFHKPPGTDFEVYNDLNGNLAALYRAVRDHPRELQERLRYVLNSREDFHAPQAGAGCIRRGWRKWRAPRRFTRSSDTATRQAAAALRRSRTACGGTSPSSIKPAHGLQKVVVENKDFEKLIRQYDRPVSFFYCDPPYVDTEDYYSNITFGRGGHERLRDTLLSAQGKFLLSYNDHPLVWEMYDRAGNIYRARDAAQQYETAV